MRSLEWWLLSIDLMVLIHESAGNFWVSRDILAVSREIMQASREILALPREIMQASRDILAVSRDFVWASRDILAVSRDFVWASREFFITELYGIRKQSSGHTN